MLGQVVAALSWDPQVRGFLIVLTGFTILVGSVYLLLATNTGARLGFLLAMAGFAGWCALMGWIWVIYGIGIKGDEPHWQVKEVVTGDLAAQSGVDATAGFPNGWEKLKDGDAILGDAEAAADAVLAPSTATAPHGEAAAAPTIKPVFDSAESFTNIGGYRQGGESYWIPGGYLERNDTPFKGWLHKPHYAVVVVRPVIPQTDIGGAPAEPQPDPTQPPTSVVMVRNLGNLRQPSMFFAVAFSILFAVSCFLLHRRDKEIMAARAAAPATA